MRLNLFSIGAGATFDGCILKPEGHMTNKHTTQNLPGRINKNDKHDRTPVYLCPTPPSDGFAYHHNDFDGARLPLWPLSVIFPTVTDTFIFQ